MIIQGTIGTIKSYLIHCIRHSLYSLVSKQDSLPLVVTPIGITTFNMHALTIKEMQPLKGQSLVVFQQNMRRIK